MLIKLFFIEPVVFLISLLLCNSILKLFQKSLSNTQYKITSKLRYFLSFLIMLILGITVGKMIIGKLV